MEHNKIDNSFGAENGHHETEYPQCKHTLVGNMHTENGKKMVYLNFVEQHVKANILRFNTILIIVKLKFCPNN